MRGALHILGYVLLYLVGLPIGCALVFVLFVFTASTVWQDVVGSVGRTMQPITQALGWLTLIGGPIWAILHYRYDGLNSVDRCWGCDRPLYAADFVDPPGRVAACPRCGRHLDFGGPP